jgi:hypothetical protein
VFPRIDFLLVFFHCLLPPFLSSRHASRRRCRRCLQEFAFNFILSFLSALLSPITDLIRHGKNHVHVHARQEEFPVSQPSAPITDARSQPERRQQAEAQPQSQPKQQQPIKVLPAATKQSQQYTREVEKIVREEREAMDKMPMYKGLERFSLIEKKGECAHHHTTRPSRLADSLYLQWCIFQRV